MYNNFVDLQYIFSNLDDYCILKFDLVEFPKYKPNSDIFAFFNGNIEASVSSFKIIYEWKNLNHIIANALGYKDYNNILVHYQTPYLGSHMSLTIEW